MKMPLFLVVCALVLACAAAAAAQPFENSSVVGQVPDRVVVTLREGVTIDPAKAAGGTTGVAALDGLVQRFQVRKVEALYADLLPAVERRIARARHEGKAGAPADLGALARTVAFDFPAAMGLQNVLAAFAALPEVAEARAVDICRNYAFLPNDPGIANSQWYLRNMNVGGGDIRAIGGWNQTLGDSNVVIAIIDSGVHWNHPDLGGPHPDKVNGAIWTNWDEYYGTPGVDDDGNGRVDDIRGWDFVDLPASQGYPDEDVTGQDNDPSDYDSHGTNCAGVAAAITNNGIGIAGAAPGCKIMALRAGWLPNGSTQGVVRMDFVSQAMIYAAGNGADVINASWGSTSYLANAVTSCQNAGILIVTAAGNDDTDGDVGLGVPSYLSTRSGVLAVAATGPDDGKASFSNYGTWVEISAPGTGIYTTAYNSSTQGSTYATVQGTSFSSPLTAGAAALIWSANPGFTYTQVANLLMSSADNLDAVNPAYAGLLGAGRVNVLKALGDNLHRYPAEFPTMYDALNSAAAGDTVGMVGGDVVTETAVVPRRGVKLMGGYAADFLSRDPVGNPTVLQGTLGSSVLRFLGGVGPDTEVDGFRIQGGGGLVFGGIPYFARYGAGVMLNATSPTLRNLHVTGNSAGSTSDLGCGGGIMLYNSSALLENVLVEGNTAVLGAGIFAYQSTATLVGCTVRDNIAITGHISQTARGGGLHVLDSDLTLVDCVVSGHAGLTDGGGIYAAGYNATTDLVLSGGEISGNSATGKGGGLYHSGGTVELRRVTVAGNVRAAGATFSNGGGFYVTGADAVLDSLVVEGNDAHAGGGGMFDLCPQATLSRSVVTGNTGVFYGGGLASQNNTAVTVAGNTVVGNDGTSGGAGGLYLVGASHAIDHNIVAQNTGGASYANGVALISGAATFACNDVFGNTGAQYSGVADPTGTAGNIAADPLFCAVDNLNLQAASPCRPENSGGCGLIGALGEGCGQSSVPGQDGAVPTAFRVDQAFPNPFNPRTTIRFALPEAGHTVVSIFDVKGRRVANLLSGMLPAQVHEVTWTGRDDQDRQVAAGVYFYLVTSGDHRAVGRMALVK
ncbi:MAG: S8 family serine peptidase [Candidatus Krumholzibacteriia bacterium]